MKRFGDQAYAPTEEKADLGEPWGTPYCYAGDSVLAVIRITVEGRQLLEVLKVEEFPVTAKGKLLDLGGGVAWKVFEKALLACLVA